MAHLVPRIEYNESIPTYAYIYISGCWFGTFFFLHILGIIIPTDKLICFRGVGIPPTRYIYRNIYIYMYISDNHLPDGCNQVSSWLRMFYDVSGTRLRLQKPVFCLQIPSGKHTKNYGQPPFFSSVNQLFRLSHFQ